MLKKYWIAFLGLFFLFLSFLYFLKLAFDEGWIPPTGIVAIGLVVGLSGLIGGYSLYTKQKKLFAEIIAGLGASIIYATLVYAGFSEEILWSGNTVLIAMIATTVMVAWVGYQFEMRVLTTLSIAGGLLTPIVLKASPEQIFLLFFYVAILNIVSLFFSVVKNWRELRVLSFLLTLVIYSTYYIYFEPTGWVDPFSYVLTLFLVYAVGLILASWKDQNKFEGLNLYLGLLNAINFVFWAIFIFNRASLHYSLPILIVGFIFMGTASIIYKLSPDSLLPIIAYFFLGIVVTGIAGGDLAEVFTTPGLHYVVMFAVWLALATVVYAIGFKIKNTKILSLGMIGWVVIFFGWYKVAWQVEWVEWFSVKFIPFINPGALLWMILAMTGFAISKTIGRYQDVLSSNLLYIPVKLSDSLPLVFSLLSHLVMGGLFTIQIMNLWNAYDLTFVKLQLMLSISWGLYAATLFLWGAYSKEVLFRWFGSAVLVIVAAKTTFFDLQGEANVYRALFLFILGVITLGIFAINYKWNLSDESTPKTAE